MSTNENPNEFVRSLARGLSVIECFDAENPRQTLSDVAKRTGMTRATARRFLHTLSQLGYVSTDGKYFALLPRVLNLGFAYLSTLNLQQLAQPYMERLVEKIEETCSISVLDGPDIVYVAREPTKRIMAIAISVGTRLPAFCTSMGKVLLSGLTDDELAAHLQKYPPRKYTRNTVYHTPAVMERVAQIRAQGWAVNDGELEEGLRSIAAPVRSRSGKVVAALNVSTHSSRMTADELVEKVLPDLLSTAQQVSQALAKGVTALSDM
ncbi:IclR family transcriptional regulator [Limnobacter litoralis]|uniref:IclR family transcriptional regulator n=1 Tax=Limnobacter litoralis TaxID=481366 RepID=A0ABQ5YP69_9BURK|nr:IclR family transcriptional regulator [Limnobacter litoralis]GLR25711.1 IclR family transcriptional regulator [Limnobacter litoralis]